MSRTRDTDFLSRWSRLKREADAPAGPAETGTGAPAGDASAAPEAAPERTDAEILAEHGLPDPDSLGPDDDIAGFMARTIPDRIRNRALRKLWLRNPVLANLDELVEYGEDYTDAATVVENLTSAWQAGRGYLKEEPPEAPAGEAVAGAAPGAPGRDDPAPGPADPDAHEDDARAAGSVRPPSGPADEADAEAPAHGAGNAAAGEAPGPDAAAAPPPASEPPERRRRMRFRV